MREKAKSQIVENFSIQSIGELFKIRLNFIDGFGKKKAPEAVMSIMFSI